MVVVISSSPIGPRACIFCEMPSSAPNPNTPPSVKRVEALTITTAESMRAFVQGLELPADAKQRLLEMTPGSYTGLAESLAKKI